MSPEVWQGPELLQNDGLVSDTRPEFPLEGHGRKGLFDSFEVKGAEGFEEEPARFTHVRRLTHERGVLGRTLGGHLLGCGPGSDDLRFCHQLVAVAVVGVGVGVDQRVEGARGRGFRIAHAGKHGACQFQVKQSVHQQALVAVHDKPRIAPTPAAVGLDPGVASISHIVESVCERSNAKPHASVLYCPWRKPTPKFANWRQRRLSPWIASRQDRQERQDSEPISCSRSDPVPAKPDQVTERNVVKKYLTSPLCGWMPSAFMNYGVTGRQQDGAALQQENY